MSTRDFLSEVSSALAARILDGTGGARLSARPVQASLHYSARRTLAAPNQRGEIIDLPAFLPLRLRADGE